ncbi:MAG TPA: hypothetical protein PKC39_00075 [Ferruginibacter sp.]|nr:hypothetical protein [Ferruginibacter sp.]HMP19325.1 hypothetical protein [Ferruginibacter sp.]
MKKQSINQLILRLRICIIALLAVLLCAFLFSFKLNDDLFKTLGISKTDADTKITRSVLGGYLDAYGLSNVKNIALGNRTAVANNLLLYVKQQVQSAEFKKEYALLRNQYKPKAGKVETPAEMRNNMIDRYEKAVAEMEDAVKKADASFKPAFQESLNAAKEELKKAKDPGNKAVKLYEQNYPALLQDLEQGHQQQLAAWETKYPENHLLFVKQRLQQFLNETTDINFDAELTTKNNRKIFVNPDYERKSKRWKMAYRAGKEVVLPARRFAEAWMMEIK